jgi:hypothetical protein
LDTVVHVGTVQHRKDQNRKVGLKVLRILY